LEGFCEKLARSGDGAADDGGVQIRPLGNPRSWNVSEVDTSAARALDLDIGGAALPDPLPSALADAGLCHQAAELIV
jgi:hypothetical protein